MAAFESRELPEGVPVIAPSQSAERRGEGPKQGQAAADIARICGAFDDAMATLILADVQARYDFGRRLHALRYAQTERVGDSLRSVAELTLMHPSVLRRFARVAEAIHPPELEGLMALRTPRGLPMTWSHLEELTVVRNRARRHDFATTTVAEGLSVRALRRRIHGPIRGATVAQSATGLPRTNDRLARRW
jgi:hypothetical protein